jgi:hypothetical protein
MWGDGDFIRLSHAQPNAQTLWFYLLTGPHTTALPGLSVAGPRQLAEALGWPYEAFAPCLDEITSKGMAWVDARTRVVALPNAPKYDPPQSPNVVRYWKRLYQEVPDCEVKTRYRKRLQSFLRGFGLPFLEAFRDSLPKASLNPVPDPIPIPDPKDQNPRVHKPPAEVLSLGFPEFWTAYPRKVGKAAALKAWTKIAPGLYLQERIVRAVERQRSWPQWVKDSGQFIPHPATWLNGRRWEDEQPEVTAAPNIPKRTAANIAAVNAYLEGKQRDERAGQTATHGLGPGRDGGGAQGATVGGGPKSLGVRAGGLPDAGD